MRVSKDTIRVARVAKSNDGIEAINKLYKELYAMEAAYVDGVHSMVNRAFEECWVAQGSHFKHIREVLNNALPCNVWRVCGDKDSFHSMSKAFNSTEIMAAQTLAMLSYIRFTEVKYLDNYEEIA